MLRWALGIGLGLVVLLITLVGAVSALADHYDLAPLAARHLAISLERKVTIGSLHVTPGRWLHGRGMIPHSLDTPARHPIWRHACKAWPVPMVSLSTRRAVI